MTIRSPRRAGDVGADERLTGVAEPDALIAALFVVFFAVDFFAVDFFAVDFFAVDFFAFAFFAGITHLLT
jgi:hypothetical protein